MANTYCGKVSAFVKSICHTTTPSVSEIQKKVSAELEVLNPLVKKKVADTQHLLGVKESTAMILLIHYEWNLEALFADWQSLSSLLPVYRRCVEEIGTALKISICSRCDNPVACRMINCGHEICRECFRAIITAHIASGAIHLVCPARGCNLFINFSNIPDDAPLFLRTNFLALFVCDFITKTKYKRGRGGLGRGFDYLLLHKKKLLGSLTFGVVCLGAYKAKTWVRDHEALIRYSWKAVALAKEISEQGNKVAAYGREVSEYAKKTTSQYFP